MDITPERLAEIDHRIRGLGYTRAQLARWTVHGGTDGITYDELLTLIRLARLYALARAECEAWREWNDRDPHEPDRGLLKIDDARAALDAAEKEGT